MKNDIWKMFSFFAWQVNRKALIKKAQGMPWAFFMKSQSQFDSRFTTHDSRFTIHDLRTSVVLHLTLRHRLSIGVKDFDFPILGQDVTSFSSIAHCNNLKVVEVDVLLRHSLNVGNRDRRHSLRIGVPV